MSSDSLAIIDISNKATPEVVGGVIDATYMSNAHKVIVSGNYAYVTGRSSNSLAIIDISNKAAPEVVGGVIDDTYMNIASVVVVSGDYAYVAGQTNGLSIINISNKTDPVAVGGVVSSYMNYPHDIDVSGNYAYVSGYNSHSLAIIDISNKAAPEVVGGVIDSTYMAGAIGVTVSGNYAYVTGWYSNSLAIVDISNKAAPEVVGGVIDSTYMAYAYDIAIFGDYAYIVGFGSNSLAIIDNISDPLNLPMEDPTYASDQPYYITTKTNSQINLTDKIRLVTCEIIHDEPADTTIKCLVSFDNKTSWLKYNTTNTSWTTHSNGISQLQTGNTISEIILGLTNLDVSSYSTLDFAFDLSSANQNFTPSIDEINISLYWNKINK